MIKSISFCSANERISLEAMFPLTILELQFTPCSFANIFISKCCFSTVCFSLSNSEFLVFDLKSENIGRFSIQVKRVIFARIKEAKVTAFLNAFIWLLYDEHTKGFGAPKEKVNRRALAEAEIGATISASYHRRRYSDIFSDFPFIATLPTLRTVKSGLL